MDLISSSHGALGLGSVILFGRFISLLVVVRTSDEGETICLNDVLSTVCDAVLSGGPVTVLAKELVSQHAVADRVACESIISESNVVREHFYFCLI